MLVNISNVSQFRISKAGSEALLSGLTATKARIDKLVSEGLSPAGLTNLRVARIGQALRLESYLNKKLEALHLEFRLKGLLEERKGSEYLLHYRAIVGLASKGPDYNVSIKTPGGFIVSDIWEGSFRFLVKEVDQWIRSNRRFLLTGAYHGKDRR